MQNTIGEWKRSSWAGKACQDCHMPMVEGPAPHRSHAFVTRTPEMLRRAVRVSAKRAAAARIEVVLEATGAGHAFPTGDMFRRLEVRADALDERGEVVLHVQPTWLGRSFRDVPDPDGHGALRRIEDTDTRVGAPGTEHARRVVALKVPPNLRVRWQVAYQRMIAPPGTRRGVDVLADEVVIATGLLPAEVE